jgi:hypothetical protein
MKLIVLILTCFLGGALAKPTQAVAQEDSKSLYEKSVLSFVKWEKQAGFSLPKEQRALLVQKDDFWKVRILLKEARVFYKGDLTERKKAYQLLK